MAATVRQQLAKPDALEPNQSTWSISDLRKWKVMSYCLRVSLQPTASLLGLSPVLSDQQKWLDDQVEQPNGYLVFPSSNVSAFLYISLRDSTASSTKDPHGGVKSARKALRHLRACQAGIPDDGAEVPSQPYIAGATSRAKRATAEARQWSVVVCCQA